MSSDNASRIEDYALIGDLHTAALVGTDGSIDWLCLPNFDSPACFASMLDTPEAGRWAVAPAAGGRCTSRRYLPETLILETRWETDTGVVHVIDFMPIRSRTGDVVRIVEGVSGKVSMHGELTLRFDYGHVVPWIRRDEDGLSAIAGADAVYVRTPAPLIGQGMHTVSDFVIEAGQRIPFLMSWAPSYAPQPVPLDAELALRRTHDFWDDWSARGTAEGPYVEVIQRSLITLKALTFTPTGGIVAAVTTSLPERPGGSRNWDYRYCWLRDSTLALQSLLGAGYADAAVAWRSWLLRAVAGNPADLQIMYALDGRRRLPEQTLGWLAGYENSAPVRVGNAAAEQLQLDVWGEVLDGLSLTRNALLSADEDSWDLQTALLEHLAGVWNEPDNGLWEIRGPKRHFTHSKVMAWVAADRMVKGIQDFGLPGPLTRWTALRDRIHADVMNHGYNKKLNTFVQCYGSTELDASLLLIPRVGFLPPDDPRVLGTIEAVQHHLTDHGLIRRYRNTKTADGLPGKEGVFIACSFWLVDALAGAGRREEAIELFEHLLALQNDVGMLSEEWDTENNRQLGNTPQAYSHLSLVNSALQLHNGRANSSNTPIARRGDSQATTQPLEHPRPGAFTGNTLKEGN